MFEAVLNRAEIVLAAGALGLFLEIVWRQAAMTWPQRLHSLQFWPIFIVFRALAGNAILTLVDMLGVGSIVTVTLLPWWLQVIVALLAIDLLFYVMHRFQHRFLWRFHSMHHSIRDMSALNSYHHWFDPVFEALFIIVPIVLLGISPGFNAFSIMVLAKLQGFLIHSQTRLHLGPLGRVIIDGRFHRIHHSTDPRHFGSNFGALTPLWDVIFGTAYWPNKGEFPEIGLEDREQPRGLVDYLTWGLRTTKG